MLAQTKTIKSINPELNIKETYTVLKANPEIKDGGYKATNAYNNSVICDGFYKNNLRDSLWIFYGYQGKISAEGSFKEGKRVGIWKMYGFDKEMKAEYDFTSGRLIYLKQNDKEKDALYDVITNEGITKQKLEHPPIFLGGEGAIIKSYVQNIKYPAIARENNVKGKVIIGITINQDGIVTGYRVKQFVGSGCDEEALRAVKLIYGDWLPGILNGVPVKVEYDMPVNFTLAN
ncbi:hypothetical protein GCM10007352_15970 [Mucilaginibacter phyllosphaerae]|nr:hypothetical protein GCM10007352_15970 [Mucilaginibacter phyllosphaerae]